MADTGSASHARAYQAGFDAGFEAGRRASLPIYGKLPDSILGFVAPGCECSAKQIKSAMRPLHPEATQKQISNALAYLTRRGYLVRPGYGRYVRPVLTDRLMAG